MPPLVEAAANVLEVIELAVEDTDDVAGLVHRGLLSGCKVDDLEAAMAEDTASESCDSP